MSNQQHEEKKKKKKRKKKKKKNTVMKMKVKVKMFPRQQNRKKKMIRGRFPVLFPVTAAHRK
ncbi:Hypothetical predicted protein, partial [Scomber scombrus]